MKFQGLILAAIILISIFIAAPHKYFLTQEKSSQPLTITTRTQESTVNNFTQTAIAIDSATENKKLIISAPVFLKRLLNTDVILAEQKTEYIWPVASLTKLMTALVVTEKIDLNAEIMLSKKAVDETEGTIGDFTAGEIYKASDLLKAMLVLSSNSSAVALAESAGIDKIAMNKRAVELGMENTNFDDPTGLSYLNQSTANDLARLVKYIYINYPEIFKMTQQKMISILEIQSGRIKTLNSINKFAGESNFLGGKTGFIDASGGNLISLFQDSNDRGPILIIVLGSDDRFGDTRKLLQW